MKAHKRGALDIVEKRNSAHSKKRRYNFELTLNELTDYLCPVYSYNWKGYGHNNALWHTMKNHISANSGDDTIKAEAGDAVVLSCLPGKQVYCEFNALPGYNLFDNTSRHAQTLTRANNYRMYCRSLCELLDKCFAYGNFFPNNTSMYGIGNQLQGDDGGVKQFSDILVQPSWQAAVQDLASVFKLTKLIDTEIVYEGGAQIHKFTNTTSLPIYIEFREFMPKDPLAPELIYGDFSALDGTGVPQFGNAYRTAGLFHTIALDKQRAQQAEDMAGDNTGPDQLHYFEDYDDKGFKYDRFMKITNSKWVVGDAIRHRIDPGNTFTYTMQLPGFRMRFSELWKWDNMYAFTGTNGTLQWFEGPGHTGGTAASYCYFPKFSKFLQVRATGSRAFTQGVTGSATGKINQRNSMADDIAYNVLDKPTAVYDDKDINPHMLDKVKIASHAVQLLHTVEESHRIRMLPLCAKYHKDQLNFMPNAAGDNAITLADDMGFMDPTSNEVQLEAADAMDLSS